MKPHSIHNVLIYDWDKGEPIKITEAEQKLIPWVQYELNTAAALRLLMRGIPTELVVDVQGGLRVLNVVDEAGKEALPVIDFEKADYDFMLKKMDEYGPKMYQYNYDPIMKVLKDLVSDPPAKDEKPSPNGQGGESVPHEVEA
jgi:hypothetical protein